MSGYDKEALKRGIEQARKNIETFELAISKERETIQEYQFYITEIDIKEKLSKNGD